MDVLRWAMMTPLVLALLHCGGDEETPVPPAEEKQEMEEPAGVVPASSWHFAIEAINVDGGRLGWKAIHLEDTLESLEAELGKKLLLEESGAPVCGQFWAEINVEGMTLYLQFENDAPDAKLESIELPLSPFGGDKTELVNRLKSKIPGLVYQPSIHEPDVAEADNPIPTYVLPDAGSHAVLLKPAEGIFISLIYCLE